MAQMTRVLQFAVFAILGLVVSSLALPATTTTTTSEFFWGMMSRDLCIRCQAVFERYDEAIVKFNMSATAAFIGELCDTTLPAVEQCMRDAQCPYKSYTHRVAFNAFLCHHRADIQAGVACWAQEGIQPGMDECWDALVEAGTSEPESCQGMNIMWRCMQGKMEPLPQCTNAEQTFVFNFMTLGTHQRCGDALSFDASTPPF